MDGGEESDLVRQLANESGESSKGDVEDEEQLEKASASTEEPMAPGPETFYGAGVAGGTL